MMNIFYRIQSILQKCIFDVSILVFDVEVVEKNCDVVDSNNQIVSVGLVPRMIVIIYGNDHVG